MMFLLRMAFWLSIVVLLVPTGKIQPTTGAASSISATEAVSAAGAAVADMRHFCERQAEACSVGAQAAVTFGQKAQAGAKLLYDFLTEKLSPAETGSIGNNADSKTPRASAKLWQNTLAPADLAPEWRGPSARKEARPRNPA
jgi:hypothetical protein